MILGENFEKLQKDTRVLREANSLAKAGYIVSIVLLSEEFDKTYKKLHNTDIRVIGVPSFRAFKRFNPFEARNVGNLAIRVLFGLPYIIKYLYNALLVLLREDADAYHAHDFPTLPLGYFSAKIKNAKIVYDSHELWGESRIFSQSSYFTPFIRFWKLFSTLMESYLSKRVDKVITVNESIAQYLTVKYKIEKPVVISNFSEYSNVERSDILRKELSIDENKKIAIYQGAIITGRGLEKLVECSKYLHDVVVVIMGFGDLKERLQKKIEKENIDNVKLLDAVPPDVLMSYTASADIGISSVQNICLSYYYSTPNKVWEYIMAGIPFAASDFPEMRKLAIDENMGVVFNPEDAKSIAEAINYLLDNRDMYNIKKENVLMLAKEKYNWEKESLKLIKLYAELE